MVRTLLPLLVILSAGVAVGAEERLPSVKEMAASRLDVWGEASVRQPGGPSYEFFKDLLPPLRYVNTAFRHYPIVLSAPKARAKARWVSNGSAVNARADKKPMWREVGFPVHFHVGDKDESFGGDLERLDGPRYAEGYLPIVRVAYKQGETTYEQEAFAPVHGALAEHGAVCVRFAVRGIAGAIAARIDRDGALTAAEGSIRDGEGGGLVLFDAGWRWDSDKKELHNHLRPGQTAQLIVLTKPLPPPVPALAATRYEEERKACVECWQTLLRRGMNLEVPEPIVQNAWRSLVIGNFLIAVGDRMHYSAGDAYDHLYEAECGDATRALLLYGFARDARGMVGPLLDFQRQATRFHVAGHKLQLLAHDYWLSRDADSIRAKERAWKPVVDLIRDNRRKTNGLLSPDRYAGDIKQEVISLSSNANCWRGLRDMAAVLADVGEGEQAQRLAAEAKDFREAILKAVAQSERRDARPPFIPIELLGDEQPHDPLTATRRGSYYDLMSPYVLGSGIFASGSERETWMIEYLRQHGGLAMGMIRSTPHQGEFNNQPGVNVLYGLRYMLALLRRDDREHALAGFYGQLAQGMTRETFVGAEGTRFLLGDRLGRPMYLPPNSASNAMFLTTLRYLLVQDWTDGDGKPDTLRLLYAVPGRWLKDGAVLNVERAPTMFGEISFRVESRLGRGEVTVRIASPPRRPNHWSIRLPLPPGWHVVSAKEGESAVTLAEDGSADLSSRSGRFILRFQVERGKRQ
ncbi:MAG TPA: hypothetical protein VH575_33540 [Gemmataceae bacterium]|jgi:hypothetical protein